MINKIAVIIPTMNRPQFVERAIGWYEKIGVPLFIGDSSVSPQFKTLYPTDSGLTHYLHCPGQNEVAASYLALEVMLKQSTIPNTPYIAWTGDDDFLLPRALIAATSSLDFGATSAYGYGTLFATVGNGPWGKIESVQEYPDQLFRVFRRTIIARVWRAAMDIGGKNEGPEEHIRNCHRRGRLMFDLLAKHDYRRSMSGGLFLMRQVHPLRVTHSRPETFRERLGHMLPRLQYLNQMLSAGKKPLSLPALRRKSSLFYDEFKKVEQFLNDQT